MQIRLTPLIDIVFILLVFFILETNFQISRISPIALPASGSTSISEQLISMEVSRDGVIWIDGQTMTSSELGNYLDSINAGNSSAAKLLIDGELPVQLLVTITDVLRSSNVGSYAIRSM